MTATAAPAALSSLNLLPRTPRMPVLFLGHGSPMNVITDNPWRGVWQRLGTEFGAQSGAQWPKPALILCVSAHWLTQGWWLTGQAQPKTVHDFGGFPQTLFDQRYPAPGAPGAARELAAQLQSPAGPMPIKLDVQEWGYDHGCWSVLKPMFPAADIPLLQLSMDYSRPPAEHYALGQQLKGLRERGVLIVGSGNIVHNLRAVQRQAPDHQTYDWALEFDSTIARQIREGDLAGLAQFAQLGRAAQLSHPTHDHLLPLLYCAGAVQAGEPLRFVNEGFQIASISMRSVVWG